MVMMDAISSLFMASFPEGHIFSINIRIHPATEING
jgi:hypothetical protein